MFDPSTSTFLNLNWISLIIPLFFFSLKYWTLNSQTNIFFSTFIKFIFTELISLFSNKTLNKISLLLNFFIIIFFFNITGLFPWIFTPTSHFSISLSLALPFWISLFLYFWNTYTKSVFAHLVPSNSPIFLASFMVIIETISSIIRPFTLAIRLSANMIAGHLLLCLLSNISEKNFLFYFLTSPFLISLVILEISVAIIQSFVFTTLMSLYINEQ